MVERRDDVKDRTAALSATERAEVQRALLAQLTFHQNACFSLGVEGLVRGASELAHR